MSELDTLYQEVILDHSKRPRNFRPLENADRHADGYNPLCGDKVTIYLRLADDRIADISFQGSGCAISTASASILTEALKGKTRAEAEALFETFHKLGDRPASEIRRRARARQAGGLLRRLGISCARQVRLACLAYPAQRAGRRAGRRYHGVIDYA